MKKVIGIVLALFLTLTSSAIAESIFAMPEVKMSVNGTRLVLIDDSNSVLPIINSDGTMYVPVKEFVESIGGTYEYDADTGAINITMNVNAEKQGTAKKIELSGKNFKDYFTISIERSDYECKHENVSPYGAQGYPWYYYSENLTLHIDANSPFEIHDVKFKISQKAKHGTGNGKESELYKFEGVMPQSGSYSSTINATWDNPLYDDDYLKFDGNFVLNHIEGYIVIDE